MFFQRGVDLTALWKLLGRMRWTRIIRRLNLRILARGDDMYVAENERLAGISVATVTSASICLVFSCVVKAYAYALFYAVGQWTYYMHG